MRHFKLAQQLILLGVLYNIVFGIDDFEITSSGTCTTAFDLVVQYTVPGTVDIVSWKFDKMADTTKTLDIVTAICQASLGADPAFPTGRMTYQCDNTNRKYTVTISSFNETTDAGKWEAKVSVGGSFTNFKEINIKCQATTTTTSTTSTTTSTSTTTTTPASTTTSTTTTTKPTTTTTTPASTTPTMPIITTTMRTSITTSTCPTTSTLLSTISTSSTKSSNGGLSDEVIIVIVIVGVIALVGTVVFSCLYYRLRIGKRKPASHERHKQGKQYKENLRPVQQYQQQPYILYDRSFTRQSNHKETKRSRSLHYDDRYNWYDGYHWGSQVKQNPVYKDDRNLGRLYYNETLPRYDDYRSGYAKGHVYPSHISGYHYRPDYHGDSRRHGNSQYSYSRQQEYINPSYSYMGY